MCERAPLFFLEAKSIIRDLLLRTVELFDLSINLVESSRLNQFLVERNQKGNYLNFTLRAPCKLNYNVENDVDAFVRRLYVSCRRIKSNLRSLHAAHRTSSNDHVVLDDEIYDEIKRFNSKTNRVRRYLQEKQLSTDRSIGNSKTSVLKRETSPEGLKPLSSASSTIKAQNSSPNESIEDYRSMLISFIKISKLYQFLLEQLYGIHAIRDSLVLQPVVISIIRLLLFIAQELRKVARSISPIVIRNRFTVARHQQMCHVPDRTINTKDKQIFRINELLPFSSDNDQKSQLLKSSNGQTLQQKDESNVRLRSNYFKVRNDNHRVSPSPSLSTIISARESTRNDQASILDFDEDEFYRLANLERDDDNDRPLAR